MTSTTLQLLAVSALIGECESLTASGDLNESQERSLRLVVAHTLAAFKMPSKPERAVALPDDFTDDHYERLIGSVAGEITEFQPTRIEREFGNVVPIITRTIRN